ncbi:MAG: TetM/TetW/TetO/TetS family tetracycline resistance ribosomal protection protein, partial [Lachnospiraceae bacterium]|nr:TetM/TetW/TetO/TetS family tetracycline resistance ribosomal protection protein [Lachnospiraceae bacterium]
VNLMGQVQTEILASMIHDRFGYVVEFGPGRISYRETIADTVLGVGHFEPLRHYAEVQLRLEAGERGSGLVFESDCPEDLLAKNWQRLILTHLAERQHRGVLTGSPITDMKISIVSGRAHPKHTMGGDFRQATYRAIRQGLKKAESVLLEPYYRFLLEIPSSLIGRAMTDIDAMSGKCEAPVLEGENALLSGVAPVSTMHSYASEVAAYTAGEGRLSLSVAGYFPCHDAEEVILARGYDSEADLANPTGSVFCAHGAGFLVPWDQVEDYMHMEAAFAEGEETDFSMPVAIPKGAKASRYRGTYEEDAELSAIFEREFGSKGAKKRPEARRIEAPPPSDDARPSRGRRRKKSGKKYLLVDGYNVIHAWQELKELADLELSAARDRLADILCNYQGYTGMETILVFDAYKVKGGQGSVNRYNNIYIIYTKEAETADAYIEKATHEIAQDHDVTVVSSDGLVQLIVLGAGAVRMSSAELWEEIGRIDEDIKERRKWETPIGGLQTVL